MRGYNLVIIALMLIFTGSMAAQDVRITPPELVFDGHRLFVSYDLVSSNPNDLFYVWLEVERENGTPVRVRTPQGDIGDRVTPGANKMITWIPEMDMVFINEEVFVEVMAERYQRSFSKGRAILLSAAMPGWGQSRIYDGSPWWLTGLVSYGTLAGGVVSHLGYQSTWDSYLGELDPVKRSDLLMKAQDQKDLSSVLLASGAAIWAANMVWVALVPQRYQPLRHAPHVSLAPAIDPGRGDALFTFRVNF